MPINPSIPLAGQPYVDRTMQTIGAFLQMRQQEADTERQRAEDQRRHAREDDALADRKYERDRLRAADKRSDDTRAAWGEAIDPATGKIDYGKAAGLLSKIDPEKAAEAWSKADAETKAKALQDLERFTQIAITADEILQAPPEQRATRYAAARDAAIAAGIATADQLPEAYDERTVQGMRDAAAGFKDFYDRVEQRAKAKKAGEDKGITYKEPVKKLVRGKELDVMQGSDGYYYVPGDPTTKIPAADVRPLPEKKSGAAGDTPPLKDEAFDIDMARYNTYATNARSTNQSRATVNQPPIEIMDFDAWREKNGTRAIPGRPGKYARKNAAGKWIQIN